MFREILTETRGKIGAPPRPFTDEELRVIRTPPPQFMHAHPNDPLWKQYRQRQAIFMHGRVVWAQVVIAAAALYEDDAVDAPATYIYSLDPHFEEDVVSLAEIADTLYNLDGDSTDVPAERRFAGLLENERRRMKLQVPKSLTDGRDVLHSCGMIPRKYLPLPRLAMPLFPLLVVPEKTEVTWLLPSQWWSDELLEMWVDAVNE